MQWRHDFSIANEPSHINFINQNHPTQPHLTLVSSSTRHCDYFIHRTNTYVNHWNCYTNKPLSRQPNTSNLSTPTKHITRTQLIKLLQQQPHTNNLSTQSNILTNTHHTKFQHNTNHITLIPNWVLTTKPHYTNSFHRPYQSTTSRHVKHFNHSQITPHLTHTNRHHYKQSISVSFYNHNSTQTQHHTTTSNTTPNILHNSEQI